MFFEQETISFQILDVFYFDQKKIKVYNSERHFDALSLRYEADTVIEYDGKKVEFPGKSLGFFPANTDYTRISNRDRVIAILFKTFNHDTKEIEKFVPRDFEKYRVLFEKALRCWNTRATSYKHETSSILSLIFAELYKDNKKPYIRNSKIDQSIKYIDENYLDKEFSLKEAARRSFVSDTYFRKLFGKEFGVSPKQYVIKKRIKRAAFMIITGCYTLEEISGMCGYNDYKHFSVEFKKETGVSPSKYSYSRGNKDSKK